jgi:AGZA family xanthine/uracil permease-like MFS transporter
MFEKCFKLSQNGTTVKTEIMAGITTFMTMAYILAVNPSILGDAGMDTTAVLLATAIASFLGTVCMAFMANLPFALSAGMGLNAFLAYTVVLGYGYSWQVALLAVFFEGIVFIVLSLTNVREAIFNAIPLNLKRGVSVGIGLFIAFIGTACMAFMANLPFALSAGMGINAFMAYTVCGVLGYSWQIALLAVFIEGIVFILLSLTKVREAFLTVSP